MFIRVFFPSALISLAVGCGAAEDSAQNHSSASAPHEIYAADAADWYRDIYAVSFTEGAEDFFDFYREQTYIELGDNTGFVSKETLSAVMEAYVEPWIAAGWSKTALHSVSAQPISDEAALITAHWVIQSDDGENVTGCALPSWRYVIAGAGEDRRVIAEFDAPCIET